MGGRLGVDHGIGRRSWTTLMIPVIASLATATTEEAVQRRSPCRRMLDHSNHHQCVYGEAHERAGRLECSAQFKCVQPLSGRRTQSTVIASCLAWSVSDSAPRGRLQAQTGVEGAISPRSAKRFNFKKKSFKIGSRLIIVA
jgi:hypothetical protein